jgi:serine/threonine protein kinase
MSAPAVTGSKPVVDFSDYKCVLTELPVADFPKSLQDTVTRVRWLSINRDSVSIFTNKQIGEGGAGHVFKGGYRLADGSTIPCAVKWFKDFAGAEWEVGALWRAASVSNAVKLHGFFLGVNFEIASDGKSVVLNSKQNSEENVACIAVVEWIDSAPIKSICGKTYDIFLFAKQLFLFLKELHSSGPGRGTGLIHGDLTADNLFWINRRLTVIDFGLAQLKSDRFVPVVTYTPYRAPEIFLNQKQEANIASEQIQYDEQIDVWSAAACIHVLFTNVLLCPDTGRKGKYGHLAIASLVDRLGMPNDAYLETSISTDKFFTKVDSRYELKKEIPRPGCKPLESYYQSLDSLTPSMKDFITRCLAWDPKDRLTVDQALDHPYIKR